MKTFAALPLGMLLLACGSSPGPSPVSPPPPSFASPPPSSASPPPQHTSGGCSEAVAATRSTAEGSRSPGEGEACGGTTHVACAEGLTCFATYRCPDSVGTCKRR